MIVYICLILLAISNILIIILINKLQYDISHVIIRKEIKERK